MPKVDFSIIRFFRDDEGGDAITFEKHSTEDFDSSEDLAAWLVLEGLEEAFSCDDFDPQGYWSAPEFVSPISGLHERRMAYPADETSEAEWREVYNQLQTVRRN